MSFLGFLLGSGEKTKEFQRYNPQQEQVLNMLLGGAQQQLPQGFEFLQNILSQSPEAMQAFERPALRQFEEQILPTIAERFTGMGIGSSRSSAFGQQLGAAGAGLSENLQAQRAGLGSNALTQLLGILSSGLAPRFDRQIRPRQSGLLEQLAGNAATAAGQAIGSGGLF
jgi:hypothetical protein